MPKSVSSQVVTAFAVSIVIFVAAAIVPKLVFTMTEARIATTQATELILSLLAILLLGGGKFAEYGFRKPRFAASPGEPKIRWVLASVMAFLTGVAASVAMLAVGGTGNPLVKMLTIPEIILFVWILSSTIEEIFTRGFLQSHLSGLSGRQVNLGFVRIELPALLSGIFFMCMHLSLLSIGVDLASIVVILLFTLTLGLIAGQIRARTGSLLPAIGVHFLANVGGMVGGIIFNIVSFVITGKLPGAS